MSTKIKISSNKSFGIVFSIVFIIIATWPMTNGEQVRIWSIVVSLIFLILGLANSRLLMPLNLIWFKFGLILGAIVAPIIMGIVFFIVITPTGFIMRIFGKDLLNKKYNNKCKSYWKNREKSKGTMKQQF